jgi:hypothetical protein
VVTDQRRPASPRRGRDADRPGPAPHAVRRHRDHRAQPLSPTMISILRWRPPAPDPVPGPMTMTPQDTSPRQMTTPLHPDEAAAMPARRSPRTGEDGRPVTEATAMIASARGMRRAGAGMCQVRNESAPGLKQTTLLGPSEPERELRLPRCSALLPQSQRR